MRTILIPTLLFLLIACGSEEDPVIVPSGLLYSPNEQNITTGQSATSSIPVFEGTAPVQFTLSVTPASSSITIGTDGVITASSSLQAGTYQITVTLSNKAGTVSFSNALKLVVTDPVLPPSTLTYSPASAEVVQGTTFASAAPAISGTAPFTYTITSVPTTGEITINTSGIISATGNLTPGNYAVSVTASNSAGSKTFSNAYQLTVTSNAVAPSALSYTPSTLSITSAQTGTSAQPSVSGTAPLSYSLTTSPATGGKVTIDANGRIVINDPLSAGSYQVSVRVTNAGGSKDFPNVFQITVTAPPASFSVDVQPIMQTNCANCHGWATDFQQVKTKVDQVLDRIQRPSGSAGFMPQGGTPLTAQQIALIQKWKDDGLNQ